MKTQTLKITQIQNNHRDTIYQHDLVVLNQNPLTILSHTDQEKVELVFEPNCILMSRVSSDMEMKAAFDLREKTIMELVTSYGVMLFQVETQYISITESLTVLDYDLFSNGDRVGRFQFEFEFI